MTDPALLERSSALRDLVQQAESEGSTEQWKVYPLNDNYAVSDHGRLFTFIRSRLMNQHHHGKGYWAVTLDDGKQSLAHRMVALTFIGEPPNDRLWVDHRDRNGKNNHISNLRYCSPKENSSNNVRKRGVSQTGFIGVHKLRKRFIALIGHEMKLVHLGSFHTQEDAECARIRAAVELQGEFVPQETKERFEANKEKILAVVRNPRPASPYGKGIRRIRNSGRYQVCVRMGGKKLIFGSFSDVQDAQAMATKVYEWKVGDRTGPMPVYTN